MSNGQGNPRNNEPINAGDLPNALIELHSMTQGTSRKWCPIRFELWGYEFELCLVGSPDK